MMDSHACEHIADNRAWQAELLRSRERRKSATEPHHTDETFGLLGA